MTLPGSEDRRTTRRELVVGGIGALASVPFLLAACGGGEASTAEAPEAAGSTGAATGVEGETGPWTFTDDRGVEVSLPTRPERIVAQEYAAAALWDYGVRPVGIYGSVPLGQQPLFAGLDLGGAESVGEVWGEVNLEALAALGPDLIVTTFWPSEGLLGGIPDDQLLEKMTTVAPIVGIHAQVPAETTIEHFEQLAGALGRDLETPELVAIRDRYDRAVREFRAAVEAKPGLRAMAVYADPEALYVAKPADYSALLELQGWGLDLVTGKSSDPYWEKVSWENADRFEADLILYDARAHAPSLDDLADIPLWRRLPAVEAGQLAPWHIEEAVSYRLFATHIEEIAAAVRSADPGLVS